MLIKTGKDLKMDYEMELLDPNDLSNYSEVEVEAAFG